MLTTETYGKRFKHKQLDTSKGALAQAAGNVNLWVLGTAIVQISSKGTNFEHEFLICRGINNDIMSITVANQ